MADHDLIAAQLNLLESRLPRAAFDEVADGLREAYEAQLVGTPNPDEAARLAVAQFGDADTIIAAFIDSSPWRRSAVTLLATGPIVGGLWAATFITSNAWTWPIALPVRVLLAVTLLAIVLTLAAVAVTRQHYRLTRAATCSGVCGLIMLDVVIVTGVLALGVDQTWLLMSAITASLVRAAATTRMLPVLLHR